MACSDTAVVTGPSTSGSSNSDSSTFSSARSCCTSLAVACLLLVQLEVAATAHCRVAGGQMRLALRALQDGPLRAVRADKHLGVEKRPPYSMASAFLLLELLNYRFSGRGRRQFGRCLAADPPEGALGTMPPALLCCL